MERSDAELTPKTRRPRRTNAERSAETRAALLDATVRCLFDLGYAGTSTTVVCQRAGVSRGAQVHHFPTKTSLVTSALSHVFDGLHAEFRGAVGALPADERRGDAAIDRLWDLVSGPTFYAWLELLVASRTDPDLREHVGRLDLRFASAIRATYAELFPEAEASPALEHAHEFLFALLEGLALHQIAAPDDARPERILAFVKALARVPLPALEPATETR